MGQHPSIALVTAVQHAAGIGGISLMTWVLWGGLALTLCGLYTGVYIWMRRPKFGEGGANDAVQRSESVGSPGEDRAALQGTDPLGSLRQPAAETAGQAIPPDVVQHGLPGTGP